ncbi:MAG: hypothetical protein JJU06_05740 [Ectothiorhodospiraceae bacterium]|nr:hypothetical protein [Ectothiorhodospiraceae bacterium]MCH8502923.1 hypothetical protein [Ectothiorhodospiraceae bacterium]
MPASRFVDYAREAFRAERAEQARMTRAAGIGSRGDVEKEIRELNKDKHAKQHR